MKKAIPILMLTMILAFTGVLAGCSNNSSGYSGNNSDNALPSRDELDAKISGEVDIDALMFTGTWVNESGAILMDLNSDRTGYYHDNADQDPIPITWESNASTLMIHPVDSDETIATFEQNIGDGTYTHIETGEICTNTRNSD